MTLDDFRASLVQPTPPGDCRAALQALWYDANGDWAQAHRIAQEASDDEGAWVHAYLHRKEGDMGNAAYWYRRAGRPVAADGLPEEWTRIARVLLRDD